MRINNRGIYCNDVKVGTVINTGNGMNISVNNDRVLVNGIDVTDGVTDSISNGVLSISIKEGTVVNVEAGGSVRINS